MDQIWNRLWAKAWRKEAVAHAKLKRQRISNLLLGILYNLGVAVFCLWLLHGIVAKAAAVPYLMPFMNVMDKVGWLGAAAAVALPALAGIALIFLIPAQYEEELPALPEEEAQALPLLKEKCSALMELARQSKPGVGRMFFLPLLIVAAEYLFLMCAAPGTSWEPEALLITLGIAVSAAVVGFILHSLLGNDLSDLFARETMQAAEVRMEELRREAAMLKAEEAVAFMDAENYQQAAELLKEAAELGMPEPAVQYVFCKRALEESKAKFTKWIEMIGQAKEKGGLSEKWSGIADQLEGSMLYAVAFTDYKPAGAEDMELIRMAAALGHEKAQVAVAHYEERQGGAAVRAEKVILQNQNWYAEISPERGANIDRLCLGDRPIYHMGDWEQEPCLQGSPILIPSNRTYQGKFSFEGKNYQLPINEPANDAHLHGAVYRQSFAVKEAAEDAVTLVYRNQGEIYPFPFEIEVTYRAAEAFEQHYTVTNIGEAAMPLTFGLHTTFAEPAEFSVPLECCQQKDEHHIPTGRYLPLNEQEQQYLTGSPSKGVIISGYYRAFGHLAQVGDLTYEVSENFDHWILFNARGQRGFLCVEPQCGAVDGLNNGCCTVFQPGEKITFWTKIKA